MDQQIGCDSPIRVVEHRFVSEADLEYIRSAGVNHDPTPDDIPPLLGLSESGQASYYVGVRRVKPGGRPLVVYPKVTDIDFAAILSRVLSLDVKAKYFEESYRIYDSATVTQDAVLSTMLSPLMVAHFLCVLRQLLKHGLKLDYVMRHENLRCKVRGHLDIMNTLRLNVSQGKRDRTFCRFHEYTRDYPENRLLKHALIAAEHMLAGLGNLACGLLQQVRHCLSAFDGINPDITPSAVRTIRRDKLHGHYPDAICLAKRILRRTDYSISESMSRFAAVPEFAIDMSRIFEFHVLDVLTRTYGAHDVDFQINAGVMGRADFLVRSQKLIIDAKYKPSYPERENRFIRDDIREVAGYSRDIGIRRRLDITDDDEVECLIIYPEGTYQTVSGSQALDMNCRQPLRDSLHKFYVMALPLPITLP